MGDSNKYFIWLIFHINSYPHFLQEIDVNLLNNYINSFKLFKKYYGSVILHYNGKIKARPNLTKY